MNSITAFFMLCLGFVAAQNCSFSLQNVGSLNDGQLRLGYGQGAESVTFSLNRGYLISSLGFICYISGQTQLQCNTPPQTSADSSFSVMNGQLSYNGSISWWSCDAGTGGSNLYTTKYYPQCVPATLSVVDESDSCATTSSDCLSLSNVGSLCDGQLRLGSGQGAIAVSFALYNGRLTSSMGFICYISGQTQLQCNTPPQTTADMSFGISHGQLSYKGSISWWSCDAGTGGSNLYTTKYYPQCVPATLTVTSTCVTTARSACSGSSSMQAIPSTSSVQVMATTASGSPIVSTSVAVSASSPAASTSGTSKCFGLSNVGSLCDGQLRLNHGTGAVDIGFTLINDYLISSLGFICYISSQTQLQCNTPPQTNADSSFSIMNGQLSYNGSTSWWSCNAGTGGSNLYTTKYYPQCVPATLTVTSTCATTAVEQCMPTAPTSIPSSCVGFDNIGSLADGQLRLGFGVGAVNVTFTLAGGYLTSSLGLKCYISSQNQLQCNTPPQTTDDHSFGISNGQLSYSGSTSWWSCDAGTGGSNLYTTKYYPQCVPTTVSIYSTTQCGSSSADSGSQNSGSNGIAGTAGTGSSPSGNTDAKATTIDGTTVNGSPATTTVNGNNGGQRDQKGSAVSLACGALSLFAFVLIM